MNRLPNKTVKDLFRVLRYIRLVDCNIGLIFSVDNRFLTVNNHMQFDEYPICKYIGVLKNDLGTFILDYKTFRISEPIPEEDRFVDMKVQYTKRIKKIFADKK